jgi:DNA-binding NarL/FixJ family response regulator
VRVVIADDSVLARSGIAALLRDAGIDVVGEAADAGGLIDLVRHAGPDAAIVDIRMPPTRTDEGILAARTIRADHPEVAVLVLSHYLETSYAMRLLEQSPTGVGYLLKDRIAQATTLSDALVRVCSGECLVDPSIVARLLARARHRNPLDDLTEREREVLSLMAEGRSNVSIGRSLAVSMKTVESHVGHVFTKLGLLEQPDGHRRVLAVLAYLRRGET